VNAHYLANKLKGMDRSDLLISHWPEGATPFTLPILFATRHERDMCQLALQQNEIYCPVHWVCQTENAEALDLSNRILSLPIDQRYREQDMDRIAQALLEHLWQPICEAAKSRVRIS
jgi:dTDP-4-amino-4,6-dideoxygalactose transaminase